MTRSSAALLIALVLVPDTPAGAQIAELHIGTVGSYGSAHAYGPGGGLVLGLAAGRLTYVGLRWTTFAGATTTDGPFFAICCTYSRWVRTRVQSFAADLGFLIPAGPVEIIPGVSLGALRFVQRQRLIDDTGVLLATSTRHAVEFLASPGVSVEIHAGRFAVIPEIQWSLSGNPDLPFLAAHSGPVVSLRLVRSLEIGRVRR